MGNTVHTERKLTAETRVRAEPLRVWEAWAEPERLKDWFMDKAEGSALSGSEMTLGLEAFGMSAKVKVLEVEPGARFVLEWPALPGRPRTEPRLWDIIIAPADDGTLVRAVSSGFGEGKEWDEEYEGEQAGWPGVLASLKYYVENHFGERRRQVTALRPMGGGRVDLRPFFTRPELISRWLADKAQLGPQGSAFRLELKDGRVWTGEVLVAEGDQPCLFCREIEGIVTLMSFPGTHGWEAGIAVSAWKLEESSARELATTLNKALDALAKAAAGD